MALNPVKVTRARKRKGGSERRPSEAPGNGKLRLYLLDVGTQQYGDCILCEMGDRYILVDGGHPSDFRGTPGHDSIPAQLESIFGHPAPFPVDLLVATHCHLDHIGCLPDLVANDLQVKWALVADEKMGFPSASDMGGDAVDNPSYRLVAGLTEENYADGLDDAGVKQFLQDAARLQDRYSTMLEQLDKEGTLVRYQGPGTSGLAALVREFSDFGLEVLGPTLEQLKICRDYLKSTTEDIADRVTSVADSLDLASEPALYRNMARETLGTDAEDRPGPGAAKNDQSIVLKLTVGQHTVLLTGDMQFAVPEVPNLDEEMAQLLKQVDDNGPYTFIKLAHHGSYNGLDSDVFKDWNKTLAFACSSGTNDATHPNSQVLALLKSETNEIEWARTDKNGLVTVIFDGDKPTIETSRGKLNDASPAAGAHGRNDMASPAVAVRQAALGVVREGPEGVSEFDATLQVGAATLTLSLQVPTTKQGMPALEPTRMPADKKTGVLPIPPATSKGHEQERVFAGKRELPKLLFVTHPPTLAANIGTEETHQALRLIRDGGQTVLEISDPGNPFAEVHGALEKTTFAGVVILGGYDVLPAQRFDALDSDLRRAIGSQAAKDGDNFIVWSDEVYGDLNADSFEEIPVTRIPDAKSSRLIFSALTATDGDEVRTRVGIRNDARPFASDIYRLLRGSGELLVSHPTSPDTLGPAKVLASGIYFMLHGSDGDGSRFWGEEEDGELFEAVNVANLAPACRGVVFTGSCWGALTVDRIASRTRSGDPVPVRTVESSMALTLLQAGVVGFVGCTGSHYSPLKSPYQYYGGPMHEAFWKRYNINGSPAAALHQAKRDYLAGLPHGRTTDIGRAIEQKVLREYTCLGLGW
jgi:beta-lactamase superfamily II metal-dependent hydrolase